MRRGTSFHCIHDNQESKCHKNHEDHGNGGVETENVACADALAEKDAMMVVTLDAYIAFITMISLLRFLQFANITVSSISHVVMSLVFLGLALYHPFHF